MRSRRSGQLPFDLSEIVTNLAAGAVLPNVARADQRSHQPEAAFAPPTTFFDRFCRCQCENICSELRLSGWDRIPFPRWPVDFSVDTLMRRRDRGWRCEVAASIAMSRSSGSGRTARAGAAS